MIPEVMRYAPFSEHGQGGTPMGVVLEADSLTSNQMLAIADAMGLCVTVFATDAGRRLRYFTPTTEVALCCPATFAAAVALTERDPGGPSTRRFGTGVGDIAVTTRRTAQGITAAITSSPVTSRVLDPKLVSPVLEALGWNARALHESYPVHLASVEGDHLMLGLRSAEHLADFTGSDQLTALMRDAGWQTVQAFVRVAPGRFHTRNACLRDGGREDPLPFRAAWAFGGYLDAVGVMAMGERCTVRTGVEIGRPHAMAIELASQTGVRLEAAATRLALSPYDEWT